MRRNIGTAWIVAEIFREFFFVAVRSGKACLDRNPGHGDPDWMLNIIFRTKGPRASSSRAPFPHIPREIGLAKPDSPLALAAGVL